MNDKRVVLVIAGPSGVGKTAVANLIVKNKPDFTFLRSVTTRAPRGDGNDSEYIYVTESEFSRMLSQGEIVEHMVYAGAMYGTPRSELDRAHNEGKTPVLVLDTVGMKTLYEDSSLSACTVYIYGEIDVIEERLYDRYLASPTVEGLKKFVARKERNIEDYSNMTDLRRYIYAFVNNCGTLEDAAEATLSALSDFVSGKEKDEYAAMGISDTLAFIGEELKMARDTRQ